MTVETWGWVNITGKEKEEKEKNTELVADLFNKHLAAIPQGRSLTVTEGVVSREWKKEQAEKTCNEHEGELKKNI